MIKFEVIADSKRVIITLDELIAVMQLLEKQNKAICITRVISCN